MIVPLKALDTRKRRGFALLALFCTNQIYISRRCIVILFILQLIKLFQMKYEGILKEHIIL